MKPSRDIQRLLDIMAALRTPVTGCSWDLAQTFESIVPYTIEETYEVADAVERGDRDDLRDELGDLLLQVVFQARIAEEEGSFDFGGVVDAITTKLVRRHPHVFGPRQDLSAEEVKTQWATIKQAEKAERAARSGPSGSLGQPGSPEVALLAGIPAGLPPLLRALKLQAKASTVGFDWNDARLVLDKIREEVDEIDAALATLLESRRTAPKAGTEAVEDEIGDLMFAIVNLTRHLSIDSDRALRGANRKFERRFGAIEAALAAEGRSLPDADLAEMERLWQAAKAGEPKT